MRRVPLRLSPGEDRRLVLEASMARLRLACHTQNTILSDDLEILRWGGTLSAKRAHLPITAFESRGAVMGGQLGAGSLARTTAELVVGLLPDWGFRRVLDPAPGSRPVPLTNPPGPPRGGRGIEHPG